MGNRIHSDDCNTAQEFGRGDSKIQCYLDEWIA